MYAGHEAAMRCVKVASALSAWQTSAFCAGSVPKGGHGSPLPPLDLPLTLTMPLESHPSHFGIQSLLVKARNVKLSAMTMVAERLSYVHLRKHKTGRQIASFPGPAQLSVAISTVKR